VETKEALHTENGEIFNGADYDRGKLEEIEKTTQVLSKFLIVLANALVRNGTIKEKDMITYIDMARY
jgi:hypothetical protein